MKSLSIKWIALLTLVAACGGPRSEHDEHEHAHNEQEAENTVASVTEEQMKSIGLQLGNIERKALTATLRVNGTVNVPNANKAVITSLYGGVIKKLNVDVGDAVKKGEVIATLVHPQFIELQEEYLNLTDQLSLAEQERNRQQLLTEGNVGARKNMQQADIEYNKMKTRQTSLRAQLELMGVDVSSINPSNLWSTLSITSPVNGVVGEVFGKQGSFVDVSTPLAEVIESSRLHVDLNVFEKDLPALKVGQQIHFVQTNNPAKNYDAQIYAIGAAFENDSKSIPVHCTVNGDKTGLIDGMNVSALISLDKAMHTAVPNEAIVDAQGKSYIFLVADKSADSPAHEGQRAVDFERIEVVTGASDMGYTAITPARTVDGNNRIVVKGAFFVNAILAGTAGHSH